MSSTAHAAAPDPDSEPAPRPGGSTAGSAGARPDDDPVATTSRARPGGRSRAGSRSGGTLDREAAERVLRRAVELDEVLPSDDRDVSQRALIEAAEELGIDPADVRRAIAEEQLGLLSDHRRRTDALVGPDRYLAARLLDGSAEMVLGRVDEWMRRGRGFRRIRRSDGWSEYARRSDPAAAAQRAVRKVQGKEQLGHVRRLRVLVADAGAGRTLVGLVVDVSTSRTVAAAGGVALAASGAASSAAVALSTVPVWWLGVPVAAAGGVGVMAGRKGYVSDVGTELESVLDAIASGSSPASVLDDVAARLLRSQRV